MDESFKNFVLDHYLWRSFGYGIDNIEITESLANKIMRILSDDELKLLHQVFLDIRDNLINTCKLTTHETAKRVTSIEFHCKYGWILRTDHLVAFLGKIIKSKKTQIKIGNFSYFSGRSRVFGKGRIQIGPYVSIGENCLFYTSHHGHPYNFPSNYNFQTNDRIRTEGRNFSIGYDEHEETKGNYICIGADSWLGADVTVKNSVVIEVGTVVGKGGLVTSRLNRYGVYVGAPAKLLKYRFSNEKIEELLESRWWEWSIDEINKRRSFFRKD